MLEFFVAAGSLFAMLSFIHFFGDWLFQSQFEAINKSKSWKVRARHCAVYTLFFIPVLYLMTNSLIIFLACVAILWTSHFVIDTYIPVALWAIYIRRIAELRQANNQEEVFKTFASLWKEPVYPILFIAVDQILHLTFLWPVIYLILL